MHKLIMPIFFFGGCLMALGIILNLAGGNGEPDNQKQEAGMPQVTLNENAATSVYKQSCLSCHGDQLQGGVGPNLQKVGTEMNEQQIYNRILKGAGVMPAFKGTLKDEDIANIALWLAKHK